jgi:hypothetical protein
MIASQRKVELGRRHLGSTEPIWPPVQMHLDEEYPLLFLKAVAKVSIQGEGRNRPWRL